MITFHCSLLSIFYCPSFSLMIDISWQCLNKLQMPNQSLRQPTRPPYKTTLISLWCSHVLLFLGPEMFCNLLLISLWGFAAAAAINLPEDGHWFLWKKMHNKQYSHQVK